MDSRTQNTIERNTGRAVAVGLSLLATYLFNLPEALAAFFRLSAVIGGLAGYWISVTPGFGNIKLGARVVVAAVSIALVAIASIFLRWYFAQGYTGGVIDWIALCIFGAAFALTCLFMGLCGVSLIPPDQKG